MKSIGDDLEELNKKDYKWRRASQMFDNPQIFYDGILPT
jgi:hypothetical protein